MSQSIFSYVAFQGYCMKGCVLLDGEVTTMLLWRRSLVILEILLNDSQLLTIYRYHYNFGLLEKY